MRGTSHVVIGVTLTGAMMIQTGHTFGMASAAVAGLGSLLPDIDEDSSTINKYIPMSCNKLIYAALGGYLIYQVYKTKNYALLMPAILSLLIYISGHRGFTHSLLSMAIFTAAAITTPSYIYPFAIGYGLHLICDMLNDKGITLLYPIKKKIRLPLHFPMTSLTGMALEYGMVVISAYLYIHNIGVI